MTRSIVLAAVLMYLAPAVAAANGHAIQPIKRVTFQALASAEKRHTIQPLKTSTFATDRLLNARQARVVLKRELSPEWQHAWKNGYRMEMFKSGEGEAKFFLHKRMQRSMGGWYNWPATGRIDLKTGKVTMDDQMFGLRRREVKERFGGLERLK